MSLPDQPSPFDIFQWLPHDVRDAFDRAATRRRFAAGEMIYSQGEVGRHMYRVTAGAVRLSVARSDGRELLYLLFEPGDCFGVSSLIDEKPLPQTAEAADEVEVQVINEAAFRSLRAGHRAFDDALLHLVSRHMRLLSGFFADAHLDSMAARIASRLASVAASFGVSANGGIELSIGLPQAELALMVGGTRQTVNRVLQLFQRDGLLSLRGGRIVILSVPLLRERARHG